MKARIITEYRWQDNPVPYRNVIIEVEGKPSEIANIANSLGGKQKNSVATIHMPHIKK